MGALTNQQKTRMQWLLVLTVGLLLARWRMPPAVHNLLALSPAMRIAAALWLIFTIYWSIAAKDRAAARTSESVWSRQFHLLLLNSAGLLLLLRVPGLTQHLWTPGSMFISAGLTIEGMSLLLAVWARRHLGKNWSGEIRIAAQHQLVCSGPYRSLRHPIYTALLGMYIGTALVSGEMHAFLAVILIVLAYWRKIRIEERALEQAFGIEYGAYRSRTWALFPGL